MERLEYEKPELGKIVLAYDESVLQYCKIETSGGPNVTECIIGDRQYCYDPGS